MKKRKLDPWGRRKHPNHYDPDVVHQMLVEDYVRNRPLGGPNEAGCQWLVLACARVAKKRKVTTDEYFQALLAEGAALTGRTSVALA